MKTGLNMLRITYRFGSHVPHTEILVHIYRELHFLFVHPCVFVALFERIFARARLQELFVGLGELLHCFLVQCDLNVNKILAPRCREYAQTEHHFVLIIQHKTATPSSPSKVSHASKLAVHPRHRIT